MGADFVEYDLGQLPAGSMVTVTLAHRANVHLVDSSNLDCYRRGEDFRGIGGEAVRSPVHLQTPSAGHWYVVLDLGGATGTIESSVSVQSRAA
jgi:hypothetical protein